MKYKNNKDEKKRIRIIQFLLSALFVGIVTFGCSVKEEEPIVTGISVLADFERLHTELSTQYAFTEWKWIDWNAKYQIFHPLIAAAEANNNRNDYYFSLRDYVHSKE